MKFAGFPFSSMSFSWSSVVDFPAKTVKQEKEKIMLGSGNELILMSKHKQLTHYCFHLVYNMDKTDSWLYTLVCLIDNSCQYFFEIVKIY